MTNLGHWGITVSFRISFYFDQSKNCLMGYPSNWLCKCGEKEEESHLLSGNCEVYGDIRGNYSNLNDDNQLVDFFNEELARRDKLDEDEKENKKK